MTQAFIVGPTTQSVTVQANATISGTSNSGGLIEVATSAPHGRTTGDIEQISGVTGTIEANAQWVVTVVDATHFTLNNSTYHNAYVSGGTSKHVGFATAGLTVDNTELPVPIPTSLTFIVRITSAPNGATLRAILQDSADAAFSTAMPLVSFGFAGGVVPSADIRKSTLLHDVPDARFNHSGAMLRLLLMFANPTVGSTFSYTSWIEWGD